jgi:3-oxoacyl-[acyl-carrier protein] reductase
MPGLLQDHVAAVTGAASGIGRAIALGFAREGAAVAVLDVNGDGAAKTAADIAEAGGKAHAFTLDVSDRNACRIIAAGVASRLGQLPASTGATRSLAMPTPWSRIGRRSWR